MTPDTRRLAGERIDPHAPAMSLFPPRRPRGAPRWLLLAIALVVLASLGAWFELAAAAGRP